VTGRKIRPGSVLPMLTAACMWATVPSHAQNRLSIPSEADSVGIKYFKEFEDGATFEGYSLQVVALIGR
jgi:hypothetical protein